MRRAPAGGLAGVLRLGLLCAVGAAACVQSGVVRAASDAVSGRAPGDEIAPLAAAPADAARGRALVVDRYKGLCLLCHTGPFPEQPHQGNFAPDLGDVGSRLTAGQLRLRIVDGRRLNPHTVMPAYHSTESLVRVAPAFVDKPIFTAQEVEDVVMFLTTLRGKHTPGQTP